MAITQTLRARSLHGEVRRELDIPEYLTSVYNWAYVDPTNVRLLDRPIVVDTLLFLNARRLMRAALAEIEPGQRVLMPAHVYGDLCMQLADRVGADGRLDAIDIVPIQVEHCRRKIGQRLNVSVRRADAECPGGGPYDTVLCFMLLHETPTAKRRAIVDALLDSVVPGGKVVFVDYHRPSYWQPIRYLLSVVNDLLEPYAKDLWRHDIADFAARAADFDWSKETYFGGVYQKTVARRSKA